MTTSVGSFFDPGRIEPTPAKAGIGGLK